MTIDNYIQYWAYLCESEDMLLDEQKKKTNGNSGRPLLGHSNRPRGEGKSPTCPRAHNPTRLPTKIDPSAEQNLQLLKNSISQGHRLSQGEMIKELVKCLEKSEITNFDETKYYSRESGYGILRIANHRGNADEFAIRNEWSNNYGIVFLFKNALKRFRKDDRVDYKEQVFLPQNMVVDTEVQIINGILNWINGGECTAPKGWETNISARKSNNS